MRVGGVYRAGRALARIAPVPVRRAARRLWYHLDGSPPSRIWHVPDAGYCFVHIPKVAMSSIRGALAAHAAGVAEVDVVRARSLVRSVAHRYVREAYPAEIAELSQSCFTFAFVRNPLERLVSAYTNKKSSDVEIDKSLFENLGLPPDVSFEEFVRTVADAPEDSDGHVRSQYTFIYDKRGPVVDFVGRFERLRSDWQTLMDRLGLPQLPHRNRSTHTAVEATYTPALARLAAERYSRDIEVFGYAEEVARLTG